MTVTEPASFRGYPVDELIDDFRLACVSRGIDDREITMQKQSRVFFQISGAGHEAIGLALARLLRPGYDWFFPYYRDQALVLGLGVTPTEILMQAVGSAEDPSSGGRQMPSHWGNKARNIVTQSSPTGSQCIPAVGCAEAARYIVRRPQLGLDALRRRAHLREPRRGRVQRGRVLGEPQHGLQPAPARAVRRARQRLRHLGAEHRPAPGSGGRAGRRVPRPGGAPPRRHRLLRRARPGPLDHRARPGRRRPRADPRRRGAAVLALRGRHPEQVPLGRGAGRRGAPRSRSTGWSRTSSRAACSRPSGPPRSARRPREIVAKAAAEALAARRPDPATVTEQVYVLPSVPAPPDTYDGGEPVPMGEAIKRTLHEVMAADERVRVFGEDVADAREAVLANVEGKGGVFGTTHGLQRAFGQARCFNTPLSEANIVGRAVGQAHPGPAPGARDPVLRLHLAGHDPDQERGGHHPLALERRVHRADGAAGADRRLPHRRGDLAQPVRREHLRPRPRPARRLPVAGPRRRRAPALRVPVRGPGAVPRAQAPAAPALHRRPVPAERLRHPVRPRRRAPAGRRPDHRDVGGHRREVAPGRRAGGRARGHRGRGRRPAHARAVGPRARGRERGPHPPPASWCTRTC